MTDTCVLGHWNFNSVVGVRLSLASVGGPEKTTTGGAEFWLTSENYRTLHLASFRSSAIAGLGGGTGGVEGALGFSLAAGIRAPVAPTHGPILRAGLSMELLGNQQFYFSHIDLPLGEVGYQYAAGDTLFEIGARGAPLLTGRYNTGDDERRELGTSFDWGGYVAAHFHFGRLDAQLTRVEARSTDPGTPVDVLRGTACGYVTKDLAFCLDGMLLHGDEQPKPAPAPSDSSTTSFYGGASFGFRAL